MFVAAKERQKTQMLDNNHKQQHSMIDNTKLALKVEIDCIVMISKQ
jgi:hypothetical protein